MTAIRCSLCQHQLPKSRLKAHQLQQHSFAERWQYRNFRPRGSIFFSDSEMAAVAKMRGDPETADPASGRIR